MTRRSTRRSGATAVECAFVLPVTFLLVLGLLIGGLGIFRYQQLASLAREGARYASVHGARYQQTTHLPAATEANVFDNAIKPKVAGLDPNALNCTVSWSPDNRQGSLVTVRLEYNWVPEAYLGGIKLSSTSTMRMSY